MKHIENTINTLEKLKEQAYNRELKTPQQVDEAMFMLQDCHHEIFGEDEVFFYYDKEIVDSRCYGDSESAAEGLGVDLDDLQDAFYIELMDGTFDMIGEKDVYYIALFLLSEAIKKKEEVRCIPFKIAYTEETREKFEELERVEKVVFELKQLQREGIEWVKINAPSLGWEDCLRLGWYQGLTDEEYDEERKNEYEEYVEFQTNRNKDVLNFEDWMEEIINDDDRYELCELMIDSLEEKIEELEYEIEVE